MEKKSLMTQAVAMAVLIVAFGALLLWNKGMKETQQAEEATVKITVENLYHTWINYEGSAVADKMYNDSGLFSAQARAKLSMDVSSLKIGYDPVLCANVLPESFSVENVAVNGYKADLVVREKFAGYEKTIPVQALKENGRWKISDISCADKPSQQPEPDFVKSGNLVKDTPGLKKGVWYLNYEQPGSPAIVQQLTFNGGSVCFNDGVSQPCEKEAMVQGMRVEVKGRQEGNIVLVQTMTVLPEGVQTQTVKLYYYNQIKDEDLSGGNVGCSRDAVIPVERTIAKTSTPVQDAINLLLKGDLTPAERVQGFSTEFPHEGFALRSTNLKNGTLTLHFNEVPGFTDGGSCRVALLAAQISKTAMQFSTVKTVKFTPETLFQP